MGRSSSSDVALVNLKEPRSPMAVLDAPSKRGPDGKQDNREHSQPKIASSAVAFPSTKRLLPVLTSLGSPAIPRPRHAAKRPPEVSSTQSSRSPSPSSQEKTQLGQPLRGCGEKQPTGKGRGRRRRGSKQLISLGAEYEDHSLSSTPSDSTDVESARSPDDNAKPHKQATRENSVCTDHDSCRSSSVSCVKEISSMDAPTLSSPKPAFHVASPRDSAIPDPTTLVSQFNLTNGQSQQPLSSRVAPNLGMDPLSTVFESRPFLNGLEDSGSGITFHGEIEQVIDGHFLESLTHGLYGSSTSSCLDSDLMTI